MISIKMNTITSKPGKPVSPMGYHYVNIRIIKYRFKDGGFRDEHFHISGAEVT